MDLFSKITVILILLIAPSVYADDNSFIDKAESYITRGWHAMKEALGFMEGPQGADVLKYFNPLENGELLSRFNKPEVKEPPLTDEQFNNVINGGIPPEAESDDPKPVVNNPVKDAIKKEDIIDELKSGEDVVNEITAEADPQLP